MQHKHFNSDFDAQYTLDLLFFKAVERNDLEDATRLIGDGANPARFQDGVRHILYIAVATRNPKMLKLILNDERINPGSSTVALVLAVENNEKEMVLLLAKVLSRLDRSLMIKEAVKHNNHEMVELIAWCDGLITDMKKNSYFKKSKKYISEHVLKKPKIKNPLSWFAESIQSLESSINDNEQVAGRELDRKTLALNNCFLKYSLFKRLQSPLIDDMKNKINHTLVQVYLKNK